MKRVIGLAAGVVVMGMLPAEAGKMKCADYEAFVTAVESIPPVLKTTDLAAYSTNCLDFALGNAIEMTRGGRIWLNWIAGEDGAGSFTAGCWSDDGGETWTDVNFVIDSHDGTITDRTNIIGCYWCDPDGVLHCFTDQSVFHYDRRAGIWEMTCANPDDAKPVWSKWRRIGNGHLMNKPIVLANGDWAFAGYLMDAGPYGKGAPKIADKARAFAALDGERGATCYVSSDKGLTWEKRGSVPFPANDWNEASVVELGDGTLRMFARVWAEGRGKIMVADSKDEGRTWTKPYCLKSMNNPNARFQVQRLKSGRLLFVKHGAPTVGGEAWQGRDHLTAYLSDDDGATWKGGLLLDPEYCSYPDCCQAPDGTIYVSHDHGGRDREAVIMVHRFTEEDVLAKKIVSSNGRLGIVAIRAMGTKANRKHNTEN